MPRKVPPKIGGPWVGVGAPIPAGASLAGIGLRPAHYGAALARPQNVGWVEVHPENYLCAGGPQHRYLSAIRRDLPVSFHGVGLSLGGDARPDPRHLARLRELAARYQPVRFSEHLAWSSHGDCYFNDLLPLPYTRANLDRMVAHVAETQEALGRSILIENPSLYLTFEENEMSEGAFLTELAARSGCGLLLDVNNLYVSAINAGADPTLGLQQFPLGAVRQIHLAGHLAQDDSGGEPILIDAHNAPVAAAVWQLYADVIARIGPVPTLIEWDNDLPDWAILVAEAVRAAGVMDESIRDEA